jgi:hypothetical protein
MRFAPPYLPAMAILPRPASPRVLLRELRAVFTGSRRQKLVIGALAIGITSAWVTLFIIESWWGVMPEGPQITYVEDYRADRTDAQIIAQQKIDQAARDKAKAERRRQWQAIDQGLSRYGL